MRNSGLIPVVEILVRPGRSRKRKSPSPTPSTSPITRSVPSTPNFSPRKRRRCDEDDEEDVELSDELRQIGLQRLSPTLSQFRFNDESETNPPLSPTASEVVASGSNTRHQASEGTFYDFDEDEVVEDEHLVVAGETPSDDDEEKTIPVRLLEDFTIYDMATGEVVDILELLTQCQLTSDSERAPGKFGASGIVKPWMSEDDVDSGYEDDNEDETGQAEWSRRDRTKLTAIVEFNIHHLINVPVDDKMERRMDRKIYLCTEFAWYILGTPSVSYFPFFAPFWTRHRLLHKIVAESMDDGRLTFERFVDQLDNPDELEDCLPNAEEILGRELRKEDIDLPDADAYISCLLPNLCELQGVYITRVPIIRKYLGRLQYDSDGIEAPQHTPRSNKIAKNKEAMDKEIRLLKHEESNTFLTPTVNKIAQHFFDGSLEVAKSQLDEDDEIDEGAVSQLPQHKAHRTDPTKITWVKSTGGKTKAVKLDGVIYMVGDVVMVEPDPKEQSAEPPTSKTVNKYGNQWWFCQIQSFSQADSTFHGQWFIHGSRTILQETSHSRALYLSDSCNDISISSVYQKCNFKYLGPLDQEDVDDGGHDRNDFHCGLMYDDETADFVNLPVEATQGSLDGKYCHSCFNNAWKEDNSGSHCSGGVLFHHGATYHLHDFIYIQPTIKAPKDSTLLEIGQIVKIKGSSPMDLQVYVQYLGRYDDYVIEQRKKLAGIHCGSTLLADERRLFLTNDKAVVPVHKIDGMCYVQCLKDKVKIESWVQHDDHFYLNQIGTAKKLSSLQPNDVKMCHECHQQEISKIKLQKQHKQLNSKLVGMELFSGAGGLGVGMDMSEFVETKYAIEFSPSAALTYQRNHPHTKVYCQDSNVLLKHALQSQGGKIKPLLSNDGKANCPVMPSRFDPVDFIFGGPPCQSFSRMNHSKRADDIRSTLPCNMLSYVEHYQPDYFLLENVAGLLDHKFHNRQTVGTRTVNCEIKYGMVKLIMRTLIALGYQVRFQLLQAGQSGVPQSRRRVIFWGAKRGIPLPEFPVPMYAFAASSHACQLPTNKRKPYMSRSKSDDPHHFAPLRPITVNDATSDLPSFDWENPYRTLDPTASSKAEERKRQQQYDIIQVDAERNAGADSVGFPRGAPYPMNPQNRYQKWLRREIGDDDLVTAQCTMRYSANIIEATVNVPLKAFADHRDVVPELLPHYTQTAKNSKRSYYGRLDGNGAFRCALTQILPSSKDSFVLHPWQKRILTVRECARAQGFPDHYIFESADKDPQKKVQNQIRQIGNAVAVPFALALGKKLGEALLKTWEKKQREGSVEL